LGHERKTEDAQGSRKTQPDHAGGLDANEALGGIDVERVAILGDRRAVSTTDEAITSTTTVDIYSKFFVDAKILGL
jgi:hypothetical protein